MAAGIDGIPPQRTKEARPEGKDRNGQKLDNILVPCITKLFNEVVTSGGYPDEWTVTTPSPVYKDKGDINEW